MLCLSSIITSQEASCQPLLKDVETSADAGPAGAGCLGSGSFSGSLRGGGGVGGTSATTYRLARLSTVRHAVAQ